MEVPAVFLYNYLYGIQEAGLCSPLYLVSYCGVSDIWSTGYFVSTVGINEATIRKYVQLQGRENCGLAKFEF